MTKKDLFRIIIRLFGLYVALGAFAMLPETIISAIYWYDPGFAQLSIVTLLVLLAILYVLIIKTDSIISMLRLDKGFDDDIIDTNNFNPVSIIDLGLITISLYFVLSSIPDILTNVFYTFKDSIPKNNLDGLLDLTSYRRADYYILTNAIIKFLLGALIIMNKKKIADRISKMN